MFANLEIGNEVEITIENEGTFIGTVCGLNQESIWIKQLEFIHENGLVFKSQNAVIFYWHEIKTIKTKESVA